MIITVASGKGGTGKTTVAVSLALSLAQETAARGGGQVSPKHPLFLDCDVEEPDAAHFLAPTIEVRKEVGLMIPEVDIQACTYCGRCAEVCQYRSIAVFGQKIMTFPELCHGCGSCTLNCPEVAIREVLHVTGTLERGWAGPVEFAQGTLHVGQSMPVPVIRQLRRWSLPAAPGDRPVILDAPPGTTCPVVETMRGSDFVLLVTEPTPFGLHDLRLAVQVARDEMGLPLGVVINREGIGDRGVEAYCAAEGLPILMHVPMERRIAEAYADGIPLVEIVPEYRERFRQLYASVGQLLAQGQKVDQVP